MECLVYIFLFLETVFSHVTEKCLCRRCGQEIAIADDILTIESSLAIKIYKNLTLFEKANVTVQLFKNPAGQRFQLVTFSRADVYIPSNDYYPQATWFPGFSWTQVLCPACGVHLGWHFRPQSSSTPNGQNFYGVIVTSLSSDSYVRNLTIASKPKNTVRSEEL